VEPHAPLLATWSCSWGQWVTSNGISQGFLVLDHVADNGDSVAVETPLAESSHRQECWLSRLTLTTCQDGRGSHSHMWRGRGILRCRQEQIAEDAIEIGDACPVSARMCLSALKSQSSRLLAGKMFAPHRHLMRHRDPTRSSKAVCPVALWSHSLSDPSTEPTRRCWQVVPTSKKNSMRIEVWDE
jgi:hypothetical protein